MRGKGRRGSDGYEYEVSAILLCFLLQLLIVVLCRFTAARRNL